MAYIIASINTTTQSTTAATGALRVQGGAGILGNLNVGTNGNFAGYLVVGGANGLTATAINLIGNTLTIGGATVLTTATDATALGTAGFVVQGGASVTKKLIVGDVVTLQSTQNTTSTVAGNALQIANGGIGANTLYLTNAGWINGSPIVTAATINSFSGGTIASQLNLSNLTNAISTATGALTVVGGAGVSGAVNIGGATNISGVASVLNTTASTSTTTGALQVSGGAGVQGNLYVGQNVNIAGTLNAGMTYT